MSEQQQCSSRARERSKQGGASERVSGASERASGPVLQSVFFVVLAQSGLDKSSIALELECVKVDKK